MRCRRCARALPSRLLLLSLLARLQVWLRRPSPSVALRVDGVEHEVRNESRLARRAVSQQRALLHDAFMCTVRLRRAASVGGLLADVRVLCAGQSGLLHALLPQTASGGLARTSGAARHGGSVHQVQLGGCAAGEERSAGVEHEVDGEKQHEPKPRRCKR